jgi:hypothetical protein
MNGEIAKIMTKQSDSISGDLFIDCTGDKSLLLGQHYKVPFIKKEIHSVESTLNSGSNALLPASILNRVFYAFLFCYNAY